MTIGNIVKVMIYYQCRGKLLTKIWNPFQAGTKSNIYDCKSSFWVYKKIVGNVKLYNMAQRTEDLKLVSQPFDQSTKNTLKAHLHISLISH